MLNEFDANVYSDELHTITESEYDEVMSLMAQDDFAGYSDWSESLEQAAWEAEQERRSIVETEAGRLMIKRDCSHSTCKTSRCDRAKSYMGIAI